MVIIIIQQCKCQLKVKIKNSLILRQITKIKNELNEKNLKKIKTTN